MADETMDLITLTADITSVYLGNNSTATGDVPTLIQNIHAALVKLGEPAPIEEAKPEPAVSIRASVKQDYLVCLEDGAKMKMLKRYLRRQYDMSPDEYRKKWGLPRNYPMVAPAYAEQRRSLAQSIGLGRKKATEALKAVKPSAGDALDAARGHLASDNAPTPKAKRGAKPKASSAKTAS